MTLGSLFDGIGVFPLAARDYGITPIWASEISHSAVAITKRHFPDMIHLGDITKLHGGEIPPVDVITFGSPCQDLSTAGNRKGIAGRKSILFYEALRIIEEMRCATNQQYPSFAIWENVAGAFISNEGMDFNRVLGAFTKDDLPMPNKQWAKSGMVLGIGPECAWRLMDAQYFRVAQRRKRIFLVADYRGERTGEILFNPSELHEIIESGRSNWLPTSTADRTDYDKSGRRNPPDIFPVASRRVRDAVQRKNPRILKSALGRASNVSPTLLTNDAQIIAVNDPDDPAKGFIRHLTPTEYERLFALPEGWTETGADGESMSDSARYFGLGNSIVLACAQYIMSGIAAALKKQKEE